MLDKYYVQVTVKKHNLTNCFLLIKYYARLNLSILLTCLKDSNHKSDFLRLKKCFILI